MSGDADKQTVENGGDRRGEAGRFAPGNAGGPGRTPGTPNKVNAVLRDDILTAYQQRGGIDWLRGLVDREFVRLIQRVLPRDMTIEVGGAAIPIQIVMFGEPARALEEAPDDAGADTSGLT